MSNPLPRVIIYGTGAMGSLMTRLLAEKRQATIVGAVDHDQAKIGLDLGEVAGMPRPLGVPVTWPAIEALKPGCADVVLLSTTAFASEALPIIEAIVAEQMSVVCIVQELFFPIGDIVSIAQRIDDAAKTSGVAVTSVGINPGFILDVLPTVCTSPCWEIESIMGRRVVDFSSYGPDEMAHIGANLAPAEFQRGVEEGFIGHIGLLESVAFVAHCCGIRHDGLMQTKEPLLASKPLKTNFTRIEEGRVRGFRQHVRGFREDRAVLDFEMTGVLDPHADGFDSELGDYLRINGTPNVDVHIKEEISQRGGMGTAAVAVNTIPRILMADPGFHTANNLLLPRIWHSNSLTPGNS